MLRPGLFPWLLSPRLLLRRPPSPLKPPPRLRGPCPDPRPFPGLFPGSFLTNELMWAPPDHSDPGFPLMRVFKPDLNQVSTSVGLLWGPIRTHGGSSPARVGPPCCQRPGAWMDLTLDRLEEGLINANNN